MPDLFRPLVRSALLAAVVLAGTAGCTPDDASTAAPTASEAPGPSATTTAPEVGGTAAPTAGSSASSAPAASGTPAPGAPDASRAADATALIISTTGFSLVDSSGSDLGTWLFRDGTGAVEALTAAFGSDPVASEEIPYEGYRSAISGWPGFEYKDHIDYGPNHDGGTIPEPDFAILVSSAAVADVAISTLSGVSVGDSMADAEAAVSVTAEGSGSAGDSSLYLRFGITTVGTSAEGMPLLTGVGATATDGTTIDRIIAPTVNWGV